MNTLFGRITALFFILLLAIGSGFFLLATQSADLYQQEVMQRLNHDLAQHLVDNKPLLRDREINQEALKELFHMLMVINPSIEIYLLDPHGNILAYSAPEGRVKRKRVALTAVQKFIDGHKGAPIKGEDPRDPQGEKVFSAAPIMAQDRLQGYLYVILGGELYDSAAQRLSASYVLQATSWILGAALLLALLIGIIGIRLLTRRLTLLGRLMKDFDMNEGLQKTYPAPAGKGDEIDRLGRHFNQMAKRITSQVQELKRNDAQRREMIANISHDLRTPLTSLHGYLETLLLKHKKLEPGQRKRYLLIAFRQSSRLIRLVAELFELAKLDSCETLMNIEAFSLAELVHDVVGKFNLRAERKGIALNIECADSLPFAYGDIGLIHRVLDNLIDNALQHTQAGGQIKVSLNAQGRHIVVEISNTGNGIPENELPHIFDRFYRLDKSRRQSQHHAGLGLAIAKRILELHQGRIWARSQPQQGTTFGFQMAISPSSAR